MPSISWASVCAGVLISPGIIHAQAYKVGDSPTEVVRLNGNQPIISQATFDVVDASDDGHSINGPSLVRVPDWLPLADRPDPSAKYYLYFGDHSGSYIRMAWAAEVTGPYTLYNVGINDEADGDGVLDLGGSSIVFTNGKQISNNHISSPDVIVDDENQQFLMFFHTGKSTNSQVNGDSWFDTGVQVTHVATSATGLNFNGGDEVKSSAVSGEAGHGVKMQPLGNAYYRTFQHNNNWYAFTNYGPIWKGPSTDSTPWESAWSHIKWAGNSSTTTASNDGVVSGGGNPIWENLMANYAANGLTAERGYAGFNGNKGVYNQNAPRTGAPRHFATRLLNDGTTLEVYYTCRGEKPESIYKTTMDMSSGDYDSWTTDVTGDAWVHERVLYPEFSWEGSDLTAAYSKNGAETNVNALRDPNVFTDVDGKTYLLYAGNPESAIGIASLNNKPIAVASADKYEAVVGETIQFSSAGSYDSDGEISSYSWNLGDGRTLSAANSAQSFSQPGEYLVSLSVIDNMGSENVSSFTIEVLAPDVAPPSGGSLASGSLDLSGNSGDVVGTVTVVGGTAGVDYQFELINDLNGAVAIDPNSGEIRIVDLSLLGAPELIAVSVKISDPYGNVVTTDIELAVANKQAFPAGSGQGKIARDVWHDVQGSSVADLTGLDAYPNEPDEMTALTKFEAPSNISDYYGQRVYGHLVPPVSGYYQFSMVADDHAQLWLSTDEDPANAELIAYLNGWTKNNQWTKFASQKSAYIYLEAGQSYYIEALHKEGNGSDRLRVAWETSVHGFSIIQGEYLSEIEESVPFAPVAPSELAATVVSNASIALSWNDLADNESSYLVEYRESAGSWSELATIEADSTALEIGGLDASTAYEFRISAVNAGGSSDSLVVAATTAPLDGNVTISASILSFSGEQDGNPVTKMIDGISGDDDNRWSIEMRYPVVELDLGQAYQLAGFEFDAYLNRAYQYTVEGSADGGDYNLILDRSGNQEASPILDLVEPQSVRYIRLSIVGAYGYTGKWVSVREFSALTVVE